VRGSVTEAGGKRSKCGDVELQALVEADSVSFGSSQGELQSTEEPSGAWDGY
jgi:hypothetical protein